MFKETGADRAIAAVVQDALTGEILWVGHLESNAPSKIAETWIFRTIGLADAAPIAVRHLSSSGEGLVIHVDGPSTRNRLDSMMSESSPPPVQTELSELGLAMTAQRDSGRWAKPASPDVLEVPASSAATLDASVKAFQAAKNNGKPETIAKRAAEVLGLLLEELRDAQVPIAMALEVLNRHEHP